MNPDSISGTISFNVSLRGDLDDVFEELPALHLPTDIALATYLKNNYGPQMGNMTDTDWLTEARELLDVLGLSERKS